jgi:A nuclease of the HNH/ENDO VII superfamily with conserved WHH
MAAAAGIEHAQPPDINEDAPLSQREPPEDWPWWMKEWFKVGRGTVTAADGTLDLAESAVENPEKVPGAAWNLAERTYDDPLGTGKALIGYDELASGRYGDWLGQAGFAAFTAGAGASTSRAARLRRVHGSARLHQLGRVAPRNGAKFAGRRMDFNKPDLNRRPGTNPVKLSENDRVELAERYPAGVRFTRAGYPVFTPYAVERVVVENLTGQRRTDKELANEVAGLPETPDDYTWHHVEDGRTMELVPGDLHESAGHTGGAADIQQARADGITPGSEFSPFERSLGRSAGGAGGAAALAGANESSPP